MRRFDFVTKYPGSDVTNLVAQRVAQFCLCIGDLRREINTCDVSSLAALLDSKRGSEIVDSYSGGSL